jgi:hypothetical protein
MTKNWYAEIACVYFMRWLPQWYEQIEDPDSFFAALGEELARQIDEFADELARVCAAGRGVSGPGGPADGGTRPGGRDGLAETGPPRTCVRRRRRPGPGARRVAREWERPMVVDRDHPSWAEVDAEQQERISDLDGREAL